MIALDTIMCYNIFEVISMFPKIPCVYMLTNPANGKFYVGSTHNLYSRMKYYKYCSKNNPNKQLGSDIQKYGFDSFKVSILEECDPCILRQRERFYIESLHAVENGYNLTVTTTKSDLMSELNAKAWQNSDYRSAKSAASSALQKRRFENPEYRAQKAKQLKTATDKMKKPVGMYTKGDELLRVFGGAREAGRWLLEQNITTCKYCSSLICDACKPDSRRKTAYGYKWKYI